MRWFGSLLVAAFVVASMSCSTTVEGEIIFEDPCGGTCTATQFCMDPGDGIPACYETSTCWGDLCQYSDGSYACVDLYTDPYNCGGCGGDYTCLSDEMCVAGMCVVEGTACPADYPDLCADASGAQYCTDTLIDGLNCGACGYECPLGCDGAGQCL